MKTLLSSPPGAAVSDISGVLVIYKPAGWTSHDVVAKVRRLLGTRKVGHTGTLDPLGTGVLPICVGNATKMAGFAQMADKVYRVTMRLGASTDTQDSTGEVLRAAPLEDGVDWEARVREALDRMVGTIWQTPPMYAAVKVGGEPLYRKARRGETVEREPRRISIYDITDVAVTLPDVTFTLSCSKGTYVRTVAADVGEELGVGAHMTALTRLACGPISIDEAISIERLAAMAGDRISEVLHPEDFLLGDAPILRVSEYTARRMIQGIAPPVSECVYEPGPVPPGVLCRVYGVKRGFFALAETGTDPVHPVRIRRIIKPSVT